MVRKRILAIAAALALCLAIGVAVCGAAPDDVNKAPAKPAAAAPPQSAAPHTPAQGVRVFIDPATGKIRQPEPEEIQQLAPTAPALTRRAMAQSGALLQGPGGATGLKLDESQMVYSVATKNADGSISFECVTGAVNAGKALSNQSKEGRQPDVK